MIKYYLPPSASQFVNLTRLNGSLKRFSATAYLSSDRYLSSLDQGSVIVECDGLLYALDVSSILRDGHLIFQPTKDYGANNDLVGLLNVALLETQSSYREAKSTLDLILRSDNELLQDVPLTKVARHLSLKGSFYSAADIEGYVAIATETQSSADAINMLRRLWRVFGPKVWLSELFNSLPKRFEKKLKGSELMFVAAYQCESGDYSKSITTAIQARTVRRETWSENRYIGLTNLLVREGHLRDAWATAYASLFDRILADAQSFPNLVRSHADDLVVVGNSPVLIGSRSADQIDRSSFVVRFNSGETRYPYSLDVGCRTDALVLNPDYSQTRRFWDNPTKHLVLSNGDIYSSPHIGAKLHDIPPHYTLHFIPSYIDRHVTQSIGASPSSGLKLLYWIYSLTGPLQRDRVFGFSMGQQASGHATSYSKPDPTKLPIVHDWLAEQAFFNTLMEGVNVAFDSNNTNA